MGTFDTLIGLANLGTQLAALTRLEDIRRQGMSAAEFQTYQNNIKNEIFKIKDNAKTILKTEKEKPKLAAGMMRLLAERLQTSGLSTDIFSEIADKEYTAETIQLISTNASRLYCILPPHDQSQVDSLINKAKNLPEYEFYLDKYDLVKQYRKEKKRIRWGTRFSAPLLAPMGWLLIGLVCIIIMLVMLFPGNLGNGNLEVLGLILLCPAILVAIALMGILQGRHIQKRIALVEQVERDVNLNWFSGLEKKYSRFTLDEVNQMRDEAKHELMRFLEEERP